MLAATARNLDDRAQRVGAVLGHRLRFRVAPGDLFTGLTLCTGNDEVIVYEYSSFGEVAAHAAHWDLDRLEAGQYLVYQGPDGDAAIVRFLSAAEIIASTERPEP